MYLCLGTRLAINFWALPATATTTRARPRNCGLERALGANIDEAYVAHAERENGHGKEAGLLKGPWDLCADDGRL